MLPAQSSCEYWRMMTGVWTTELVAKGWSKHQRTHSVLTGQVGGRGHQTPNHFKDQTFEIHDLSHEKKSLHQQLRCPGPEEWTVLPWETELKLEQQTLISC